MVVGVVEGEGRLADELAGVGDWQRAEPFDQSPEIEAVDKFHDQIVHLILLAGIGGPDDVWMVEFADRFHFPLEPGDGVGVLESFLGQHLEGDQLVELRMQGLVNGTHAPFAQYFQQAIIANEFDLRRRRDRRLSIGQQRIAADGLPLQMTLNVLLSLTQTVNGPGVFWKNGSAFHGYSPTANS